MLAQTIRDYKNANGYLDAVSTRPPPISDKYLFLDLEMTGLYPERHTIVECALIVTDKQFNIIREDFGTMVVKASLAEMAESNDYVIDMHCQSNLYHECSRSKNTIQDLDTALCKYLDQLDSGKCFVLAGNSIWKDREFITKYLVGFNSRLHHQQIDVSSFKLVFLGYGHPKFDKGNDTHRALEDTRKTIEELKYYVNRLPLLKQ
ncbi:hypothetical protein GEMRC1_000996 [Eukaryota sp. GEM-RC1]